MRLAREKGGMIVSDPYVPFDSTIPNLFTYFDLTMEYLTVESKILVVNRSYYGRYLGSQKPSEYVIAGNPLWHKTRAYYEALDNKKKYPDHLGNRWQEVYSDNCSWRIFVKE